MTGIFGAEVPLTSQEGNALTYELAIEYSLPSLQQFVKDIGIPTAAGRFFPVVELLFTGDHTAGDLFWWVSHRMRGSAMPAFGDRLSESDCWDVINFVRTLASAEEARLLGTVVTSFPPIAARDLVVGLDTGVDGYYTSDVGVRSNSATPPVNWRSATRRTSARTGSRTDGSRRHRGPDGVRRIRCPQIARSQVSESV